jgi:uncharacterized protein YegL
MPQEWARKRHMPRLAQTPTDDMQNQTVGTFQFSAIRPDRLGGVEWTLVNISLDASPSISGQQQAIADACIEALTACQKSPRANNLVARVSTFGDSVKEVHGYMPLHSLDLKSYRPTLHGVSTCLNDAAYSSVASAHKFSRDLLDTGMTVNCITFIITDGLENSSKMGAKDVKEELARAMHNEDTESHLTILIGVNVQDAHVKQALKEAQKNFGFSQFIDLGDATASNLAKLAQFVSKSISSQSQSLGSGGASQPLAI